MSPAMPSAIMVLPASVGLSPNVATLLGWINAHVPPRAPLAPSQALGSPRRHRAAVLVRTPANRSTRPLAPVAADAVELAYEPVLGVEAGALDRPGPGPVAAAVVIATGRRGAHDRERGSRLVRTVEAFVRAGGNGRAAARELGTHRNTLAPRLERITALTGL